MLQDNKNHKLHEPEKHEFLVKDIISIWMKWLGNDDEEKKREEG